MLKSSPISTKLIQKYPRWKEYFTRNISDTHTVFIARPDGTAHVWNLGLTGIFFGIIYNPTNSMTGYPEGMSGSFYRFVPDSSAPFQEGFRHVAHVHENTPVGDFHLHQGRLIGDPEDRVVAATDWLVHPGLFEIDLIELFRDVCEANEVLN